MSGARVSCATCNPGHDEPDVDWCDDCTSSGQVVVGATVLADHGDKVVERVVVEVTDTLVTSESRWVSGTPYEWGNSKPHSFRWTCSHREWIAFTKRRHE